MCNKKEMTMKIKMIIFKEILIRPIEIGIILLVMLLLTLIKLAHIKIYHHRMSLHLSKLIITMKNASHKSLHSDKTKDLVSLSTLLIFSMLILSLLLMEKDKLDLCVEEYPFYCFLVLLSS